MKTDRKPRQLVCLRCEHTEFAPATSTAAQEFRGETLEVAAQVMRCTHCGWETLAPGQLDALRLATADAYRSQHGLLTSGEIRACREALGLSQRAFAARLSVGEASIPRWESSGVQEKVYDDLIRSVMGEPECEFSPQTVWSCTLFVPTGCDSWESCVPSGVAGLLLPEAATPTESLLAGLEVEQLPALREWEAHVAQNNQAPNVFCSLG